MKKPFLIVLTVLLAFLFFSAVWAVISKDEIVYYFALQQEVVGDYEKAAFASGRSGEPKEFSATVDGVVYTIPLPDGATEFSNDSYPQMGEEKQFLVINYEIWNKYIEKIENLPDYDYDRMGLSLVLGRVDTTVQSLSFGKFYAILR